MDKLRVIFPSMPFEPKVVDPDFSEESSAVIALGGEIALFDFDQLKRGKLNAAFSRLSSLDNPTTWIYRGWMMRPGEYKLFHKELENMNYNLLSSPMQYSICHVFPFVYPYIKKWAIKTYYTENAKIPNLELEQYFGATTKNRKLFVKDWVKSAKDVPGASVINDYMDWDQVESVCDKLKTNRGEDFYYGYVFKEFVNSVKRPDGRDEEYRAFIYGGAVVSWDPIYGNSGKPALPMPEWIKDAISEVPGEFFTLDFLYTDKGFVILEAGDAGVSGFPKGVRALTFYDKLNRHMIKPTAEVAST